MDLKEISKILSESTRNLNQDDAELIRNVFDLLKKGIEDKYKSSKQDSVGIISTPIDSKSISSGQSLKLDESNDKQKDQEDSSIKKNVRPKEEILKDFYEYVVNFEDEEIADVAEEYIEAGYDPYEGIQEGLIEGMNKVSELYDEGEYFITDILLCSDAMYAGLDVLRPHLENEDDGNGKKAVIGVVEGDTHDIGKNLVKIMMETAGFEMIDLGRDVPLKSFVDAAIETDADLVCMSTLMTTTMGGMEKVVEYLEEAGIRDKVKIMVGGGCITQKFCNDIGADAYTPNAVEAVKKAKELVGVA